MGPSLIGSTNISHVGAVTERYKHVKQWPKKYVAMLLNKGFIINCRGHLLRCHQRMTSIVLQIVLVLVREC